MFIARSDHHGHFHKNEENKINTWPELVIQPRNVQFNSNFENLKKIKYHFEANSGCQTIQFCSSFFLEFHKNLYFSHLINKFSFSKKKNIPFSREKKKSKLFCCKYSSKNRARI